MIDISRLEVYRGRPLYLFIGIDTAGSRVHQTFPHWAQHIGLDADLQSLDLPADTHADTWDHLVRTMRDNPAVHGAVITSHKLRLYRNAIHLIDTVDPLVGVTHELNALDTRGPVRAFARDAQSLDVLLNGSDDHIADGRPIVCLGSGGSAIALLLATQIDVAATIDSGDVVARETGQPALTIVGRQERSLADVRRVLERTGLAAAPVRLAIAASPEERAATIVAAEPSSLIINATGLGKSTSESPLPGPDAFPPASAAWDFNYRGPLTFLDQARSAGVQHEDGWEYFLAGWACALASLNDHPAMDVLASFRKSTPR